MEHLKKKIEKIAEQHSHIRNGLFKWFGIWLETTSSLKDSAAELAVCVGDIAGERVYLAPGYDDFVVYYDSDNVVYYNRERYCAKYLPIPTIRRLIKNIPTAIEKFKNKLEKIEGDNEKIIEFLDKCLD